MLKAFKPPDVAALNLRAGTALSQESALILAGLEKLDSESVAHTVVLLWRSGMPWLGKLVNWTSASACAISEPSRRCVLVGERGEFSAVNESDDVEGTAMVDAILRSVMSISGLAHAVGMGGTVLRYDGGQSWTEKFPGQMADEDFEAIAGYSSDEIYVVGARGAIWLLSGGAARRVEGLTNLILTSVCCAPDGQVYVCGQNGLILHGRGDQWRVVDHGDTKETLWDIHAFRGRIYVASLRFLYELKNERLVRVRFGGDLPRSFYKLSSVSDDVMLSIGHKDAFIFDGVEWTRVL